MTLLALPFPEIDPVAFEIGPLSVKWYGLAYLAGLVLGWLYIRRLLSEPILWPWREAPFTPARTDDLLLYMTLGVVIGGRLGFVLFYEPLHYFYKQPFESVTLSLIWFQTTLIIPSVLMIWKGGMAFHGALLGCGLAIWLFSRHNGVSTLSTMDICAASVPIGLFFGRIANFINGELFGRPTDMPWGMVFPEASIQYAQIEPTPRHPSQLYEAFFEGLVLFLVLRWMTHNRGALSSPGLITGVFLSGYALARSFCELYRQPDPWHAFTAYGLTPGIVYSIPMFMLGLWFIARARKTRLAKA